MSYSTMQGEEAPLLGESSSSSYSSTCDSHPARPVANTRRSQSGSSALTEEEDSPLPKTQLAVVLSVYLAEPVTRTVIYPFLSQLITELGIIHGDSRKVGYYTGLFDGLPLITEAIATLAWSSLSDHIGRKPVILCSSLGLAFASISFGLQTKSLVGLVLSRALLGLLNGNTGAVKTIIGELAHGDEQKLAKAFGMMPIVFATGLTLAPAIGGLLEHPAKRFPGTFGSPVWEVYPYLLPCLVAALFPLLGFTLSATVMKETRKVKPGSTPMPTDSESEPSSHSITRRESSHSRHLPRFCLTRKLAITLSNYAAFIIVSFPTHSFLAIFLAAPVGNSTTHAGGLGLPPSTIGLILATFGFILGGTQALFFPRAVARFGVRKVFRIAVAASILFYLNLAAMHTLAVVGEKARDVGGVERGSGGGLPIGVWISLGLQAVLGVVDAAGWGCMYVMITQAAPSPAHLATTNGLGQILFSLFGSLSPTLASSLFAFSASSDSGSEHGPVWDAIRGKLVYVVMVGLGLLSLYASVYLEASPERTCRVEKRFEEGEERDGF